MERDPFEISDQTYLRDVQYKDPVKLTARADLHVKYATATIAWVPWLVAQLDWPSAGDVLEVGCGPGWLWSEGAKDLPPGLRLTLTDLSAGMVDVARERADALSHFEAVEARVTDAQTLPFDDHAFDVVVANHMLYHVPDPARALSECARVLRPDGVLMAATNGPRHLGELWEVRSEVFGGPPPSVHTDVFGSVSGRPLLEERFAEVERREYEDVLHCTDPEDAVAFLTSSSPGEDASQQELLALRRALGRAF